MTTDIIIKLVNGKWTVNDKLFTDMSFEEKNILGKFITEYNREMENSFDKELNESF